MEQDFVTGLNSPETVIIGCYAARHAVNTIHCQLATRRRGRSLTSTSTSQPKT
jgi:hypothetical protein